jgi:ferredoxin-NADP reductase
VFGAARALSGCDGQEERFVPNITKYPPLLSPLLVKRTVRGMRLVVTGFTGPYTLPDNISSQTDHLVHVCAGSGSVPNLSILKFALDHHPTLRHTFVYSNKTWSDVIYRDTLAQLAASHPGRLTVVHTLTREDDPAVFGPRVRKGRVDTALLTELIPDPRACVVYVCGPGISKFDREAARNRDDTSTALHQRRLCRKPPTIRSPRARESSANPTGSRSLCAPLPAVHVGWSEG